MFLTVTVTAALLWPGTGAVLEGLFVPRIPDLDGEGLTWTVALIGGVGGTLTVLCYGYWLREAGLTRPEDLKVCRLDLGSGYLMTAAFGIAMIIVGSNVTIEGGGAELLVTTKKHTIGDSTGSSEGTIISLIAARVSMSTAAA
jgi:hypothetical protein